MSNKVNLGGGRLQSGAKMEVELPHYERSTFNLTSVWKSTMSPGTVVPIMGILGQNEDTFDIDYDVDIQTEPTLGALYGSFKFQIDTFKTPIHLYNPLLLINDTDFDAKKIFFPIVKMYAANPTPFVDDIDNYHTHPSSIFRYMGIAGLGHDPGGQDIQISREFPIIKWLIYWDVMANYYCNKQEPQAWVIHNKTIVREQVETVKLFFRQAEEAITKDTGGTPVGMPRAGENGGRIDIVYQGNSGQGVDTDAVIFILADGREVPVIEMFYNVTEGLNQVVYTVLKEEYGGVVVNNWRYVTKYDTFKAPPRLVQFPLENIAIIRKSIMQNINENAAYVMDIQGIGSAQQPYSYALEGNIEYGYSATRSQEGLGVKTYQSDKFNNYLRTEWITGAGGVNELSRIDVSSGYLEIEALNLGKKVYKMLNAVAAADKTYSGFQKAIWGGDGNINETSPVFIGGLSKEIGFQEVVSNGGTMDNQQPLGTIVGRGKLTDKHNGGKVSVRIQNPSYVTAYASITPYVSYSQGNEWDMNLKTLDDVHKPALDQIGFQDRDTDEMAWWDTNINASTTVVTFNSVGKQPAWIDYMTDVDRVYGNFAIENSLNFMVLTRRYQRDFSTSSIKDATTYIDPSNFNHIFAQTSLDAMNFRVMIRKRITARRKLSSKIMPNV